MILARANVIDFHFLKHSAKNLKSFKKFCLKPGLTEYPFV
jgi:hypothetical protein